MRCGLVAAIASTNDLNGAKPRYGQIWPTARVLPSGWRDGQTASTVKPAFARATASRAVGNHLEVVATRTVGFMRAQASWFQPGLLRCKPLTRPLHESESEF